MTNTYICAAERPQAAVQHAWLILQHPAGAPVENEKGQTHLSTQALGLSAEET